MLGKTTTQTTEMIELLCDNCKTHLYTVNKEFKEIRKIVCFKCSEGMDKQELKNKIIYDLPIICNVCEKQLAENEDYYIDVSFLEDDTEKDKTICSKACWGNFIKKEAVNIKSS